MTTLMLRVTLMGLALVFTLTGLALLGGRGEDSSHALAAYDPYMPGNRLPTHLPCQWMTDYTTVYGLMCSLDGAPYCQRGYVIAQEGIITYLRLTRCDFPVAYLMAQRGRFERMTHYRRIVILLWTGMSAQMQRTGRFHTMQQVSSVGWWIPS